MPAAPRPRAPAAWILLPKDHPALRLFGLTPEERLRRQLAGAGCTEVARASADAPPPPPRDGSVLIERGDAVLDPRLVAGLVGSPGAVLVGPPGDWTGPVAAHVEPARAAEAVALLTGDRGAECPAGLRAVRPRELAPAAVPALRKAAPPRIHRARAGAGPALEAELFRAAYKDITDLVTKWVWPAPALAATRALARRGVSPNTVTAASWVCAVLATVGFATGHFAWGALAAWALAFLDTVDGKLARVTVRASRAGHVLDHGLDLLHPPFWYAAWAAGLGPGHEVAAGVAVGGYLAGRLLEGAFLAAFGFETHSWRTADALFRTITARRNPNLILLCVGLLARRPDLGLVLVALWTVLSLAFHALRLAQALVRRRRGEEIAPGYGGAFR